MVFVILDWTSSSLTYSSSKDPDKKYLLATETLYIDLNDFFNEPGKQYSFIELLFDVRRPQIENQKRTEHYSPPFHSERIVRLTELSIQLFDKEIKTPEDLQEIKMIFSLNKTVEEFRKIEFYLEVEALFKKIALLYKYNGFPRMSFVDTDNLK